MKRRNVQTSKRRNTVVLSDLIRDVRPLKNVALVPLQDADGDYVENVILPIGEVESVKGNFVVDREAWEAVERAFKADRRVPVDFEHTTLGGDFATSDGRAPAVGWIEGLRFDERIGIIASVKWTQEAREMIRADMYRYWSPVIGMRRADRRVVALHSAGLTNKPAIRDMPALAAKQTTEKERRVMAEEPGQAAGGDPGMLVAEIKALLNLEVENDTDVIAVLRAIRDWAKKNKGGAEGEGEGEGAGEGTVASKKVLSALGAKAEASESELVVMISALKQGADSVTAMKARLDDVETKLAERAADDLMRPHIKANKINPNAKATFEEHKKLAMTNPKRFEEIMAETSPYAEPGKTEAPDGNGKGAKSREQIIAHAAREYDEGEGAQITNRVDWINGALRDAKATALTDDEKTKLVGV